MDYIKFILFLLAIGLLIAGIVWLLTTHPKVREMFPATENARMRLYQPFDIRNNQGMPLYTWIPLLVAVLVGWGVYGLFLPIFMVVDGIVNIREWRHQRIKKAIDKTLPEISLRSVAPGPVAHEKPQPAGEAPTFPPKPAPAGQ
jgi:hypothetical protein